MRFLVMVVCLCLVVGVAAAQDTGHKDKQQPVTVMRIECGFESVATDISFGADTGGFGPMVCDVTGGLPVWDWGTDATIPPPPAPYGPNVWGTVLGGPYINNSGDGLMSVPVVVEVGVNELVEVIHYVDIETNYDGCNMVVTDATGETILVPLAGYPATISTSTYYYAYCLDMEDGYTGHDAVWTAACADLSPWDGQEITIRFDFGSDTSVTYPGWYIAGVRFGTDQFTPVEEGTWGTIKALYR